GIRDWSVPGVQTCALPIWAAMMGRAGAGYPGGRSRSPRLPNQPAGILPRPPPPSSATHLPDTVPPAHATPERPAATARTGRTLAAVYDRRPVLGAAGEAGRQGRRVDGGVPNAALPPRQGRVSAAPTIARGRRRRFARQTDA